MVEGQVYTDSRGRDRFVSLNTEPVGSAQLRAYVWKEGDDKGEFDGYDDTEPGVVVWMDEHGSLDYGWLDWICNANFSYEAFDRQLRQNKGDLDWACEYLRKFGCVAVPFEAGDRKGIVAVGLDDVNAQHAQVVDVLDELREQASRIGMLYNRWEKADGLYGYAVVDDGTDPVQFVDRFDSGLGKEIWTEDGVLGNRETAMENARFRLQKEQSAPNADDGGTRKKRLFGRNRRWQDTRSTMEGITSGTPTGRWMRTGRPAG